MTLNHPQLSVVIVITGDTLGAGCDSLQLDQNLQALADQIDPPVMEIIVPVHQRVFGIDELKSRFPDVSFLTVDLQTAADRGGSREHHDELRAHGVAASRGSVVACLEDHVCPERAWGRQILKAHEQRFAAIGGAIENDVDQPVNWAAYFCDLGKYQNPVPGGESAFASVVNVSYKRSALESIRPTWSECFNETRVNHALLARGEKLALCPEIVVQQCRRDLRLGTALQEFRVWGGSYARTRCAFISSRQRVGLAILSPLLPGLLLLRLLTNVLKKGRSVGAFFRALPWIFLLTVSWCWGETTGYLTARPNFPKASSSVPSRMTGHGADGRLDTTTRPIRKNE